MGPLPQMNLFGLPWAVSLGIGYHGLLAGYPTASALGFPLALSEYLLVRRIIHQGIARA